MDRRQFLLASGVSIGLPYLASAGWAAETANVKRRMVCVGNMLGFYPDAFWPEAAGTVVGKGGWKSLDAYALGESSRPLEGVRDSLTMISGLDHDTKGGHFAIHSFLSGVRQIDAKSMPDANVTIDQFAAASVIGQTRFPSLTIGSESGIHGGCQLSWTRTGTRVPPLPGPEQVFQQLFVGTSPEAKEAAADRFRSQSSILDLVLEDANRLERRLNTRDRHKLDEYFSSIRDVEQRLTLKRNWIDVPKPEPPFPQPNNRNMVEDLPLLYDLIVLALQTDSTRIATLEIGGDFNPRDLGVSGDYHALSHHGQLEDRIKALITLETYQCQAFADFVEKLGKLTDGEHSLLDQTMVLFGSGMGNANSHTNTNLPVVLAGGGFRHGRLLAFDPRDSQRPPLTNLFLSMLNQFGMEVNQFATSTGTLRGLEA